jgi:hypothetical protein
MSATVYLCSPTNSTLFTSCCHVAILDDQPACPKCGTEVLPETGPGRWEAAYGPIRRGHGRYGSPVSASTPEPLHDYEAQIATPEESR